MSRRIRSMFLPMVAVALASADPMPYDSIGNPLNKLPATDKTIQGRGDTLNMTLDRVRVNQAGYRQRDVAEGYAKFYCVGCTGSSFSVVNASGLSVGSGSLVSKGGSVSGQITAYTSNSAEHAHNGEGDWKKGYPMTGATVSGALTQGILPKTLPVGKYVIRVGADSSAPFVVSDNVYGMARDAALKFFGVARSGDYESWFHPASHMWDGWLYDSAAKNADGSYKYKGALKGRLVRLRQPSQGGAHQQLSAGRAGNARCHHAREGRRPLRLEPELHREHRPHSRRPARGLGGGAVRHEFLEARQGRGLRHDPVGGRSGTRFQLVGTPREP